MGFPGGTVVKTQPANSGDARDMGLIPGSGRSPGIGNINLLQNSYLKNSMNRKAWQALISGVADSCTRLNTHPHTFIHL